MNRHRIRRSKIWWQNGKCVLCGEDLRQPTVEHLTPASKGGPNSSSNYAVSCKDCNHDRGASPLSLEQLNRLSDWYYESYEILGDEDE